jgi:two-component system, OmpR family, response regulator RpaA
MAARRRYPETLCAIVIEDDFDARTVYAEYLRAKGWIVMTAADGRIGLTKTLELRPDAVVLDLAMPKVDGWTVLRQIRASSMTAEIPVLVVSALTDSRDAAIYAGADAYLSKPCPPEVVYLQLQALTRMRSARADFV